MKAAEDRRLKLYHTLCLSLSNRLDQVAWDDFTPADWRLLAPMAKSEGVAPLLYRTFQRAAVPALKVPARILAFLASEYYQTAAQNMLLYQALDPILAALQAARVPVIVLKGAALANALYPDIALRPMNDLDLLVMRDDLEKAVGIIAESGYSVIDMAPGFSREFGHHIYFKGHDQHEPAIELHWNLVANVADWRSPPLTWFWENATGWQIGSEQKQPGIGPSALQLSPEAHLLYLAAHLMYQHLGAKPRLMWFYDIHLLICRFQDEIDWDEVLRVTDEFNWIPILYDILNKIKDVFNTPLPSDLLNKLTLLNTQSGQLAKTEGKPYRPSPVKYWGVLKSIGWGPRLRWMRGMFFPSLVFIHWYYDPKPDWLWPICYLRRWFNILKDGYSIFARMTH
jgi:hypothetical protein